MLEKIDLSRKLEKGEFKALAPSLMDRLGELQRLAKSAQVPILILFEGWDAAGKGTLMNQLIQPLDPRGFRVHNVHEAGENDRFYPPLKPFWDMTPPKGRIGIFNKSWYRLLTDDFLGELDPAHAKGRKNLRKNLFDDILSFEGQLAQDGNLIIKFFLHISKKEQKKRLKKLSDNPCTQWRVGPKDWMRHENYDATIPLVEEFILKTDKSHAPWTIVEAHDPDYACIKILTTVSGAIEAHLARIESTKSTQQRKSAKHEPSAAAPATPSPTMAPTIFRNLDMNKTISDSKYHQELEDLQDKLTQIGYELYQKRRPMVIAFEGVDAAGKGGCIKRLTQCLDPRGYEVIPTSAPNDWEKAHHYLWRFWTAFPKAGHIGIYDRTWYGRVLVERVEGFATEEEWKRAYAEINEMEEQWLNYGAILLKFWLQIDQDEQFQRFSLREDTPQKQWKITDEDWRNRDKWPLYEIAAEEMLLRTSTKRAPWHIVEANDKHYARLKVLKTVAHAAIEELGLKNLIDEGKSKGK